MGRGCRCNDATENMPFLIFPLMPTEAQDDAPNLLDAQGRPLQSEPVPTPRWKNWTTDHSLIATVALSVISLCALVVSIYQARVLSSQQQAMEAQQEIMIQNAKAQLWPNLQIGLDVNTLDGGEIALTLSVTNSGTGPAIIDAVQIELSGKYVRSYPELWTLMEAPDTLGGRYGTSSIGNRTIQAGERVEFLRFGDNYALASLFYQRIIQGQSPTFYFCYRSVFDDHYLLEGTFDSNSFDVAEPVENCELQGLEFDSRSS